MAGPVKKKQKALVHRDRQVSDEAVDEEVVLSTPPTTGGEIALSTPPPSPPLTAEATPSAPPPSDATPSAPPPSDATPSAPPPPLTAAQKKKAAYQKRADGARRKRGIRYTYIDLIGIRYTYI